MTKTENYALNQWAAEDAVRRTDFNEDNAKLDAALSGKADASVVTALQTTVAGKADASVVAALQTTVAGKADASVVTALQTTVAKKADATALTALQTVVNGKADASTVAAAQTTAQARALAVSGSYVGTGLSGSANPNKLDFTKTLGRAPLLVIIRPKIAVATGMILVAGITNSMYTLDTAYTGSVCATVSWSGCSVSWYGSQASYQLNESNTTYQYVAIG